MAEETQVFKGKLKHSGLFDFKELYKFVFNFFKENKEYSMLEKSYSEKVGASGKEVEIKWEATKKVSDYFKIVISIDWRIIGLTNVEAKKNGEVAKTNKGDLEIAVAGKLIRDYENKWETSPMIKFMRSIYDKYIIKNKITELEDKIFGDCDESLGQIKAFLVLEANK